MGQAAWLIHSAAMQRACRGLSFLFRPSTHTYSCAHSFAHSYSAWRLPLLQLTLVLPLQGETCAELLTLGLIFLLFLPISSVSCCRSLEETKDGADEPRPGFRGEEENIVNSHHLLLPAMFGVAKEIREFQAL